MRSLTGLFFLFAVLTNWAQTNVRAVCVSVDDLPANSIDPSNERFSYITSRLLEVFDKYKVPAIGFVNEGKLFTQSHRSTFRESMLKQWHDRGFELGNHTYSHIDINNTNLLEYEKDLIQGEQITNELYRDSPQRIKYFRHPFLHCGNTEEKKQGLKTILEKLDYVEAPVTLDNSEWIFARAYDIALQKKDAGMSRRIGNDYVTYMMEKLKYFELQSQALFERNIAHILLIHANTLNADWLGNLLKAFRESGYQFISIGKALEDPAYKSENSFVGNAGISWLHRWAISQKKSKDFFAGEPSTPKYVLKYSGIESE
jgi:peptidoglycan/xylan/chitin deacetylase (PgdA/CDA1 family)